MRNVEEFIAHLHKMGVSIWVEGDRLAYRAPKDALTPALLDEMRQHKAEILAVLQQAGSEVAQVLPLSIQPVSHSQALPPSFAQQRLWFLDQLEGAGPLYNVSTAVYIRGELDASVLRHALNEIICRYEVLRTTFKNVDGQPVQVIHPTLQITLPVVDLRHLPLEIQVTEAQRLVAANAQYPFDLAKGPLIRAQLLQMSPDNQLHTVSGVGYVLLITVHHIVFDGWSSEIFNQELAVLYDAFLTGEPSPLPDLAIQYADFAVWQQTWLQGERLEKLLAYWTGQLADAPTTLELMTDRPRPVVQTFRGGSQRLEIEASLLQKLKVLSQQSGCTLFMNLLAAFAVLLARYSGQDDLVIGSPIANRNHKEIESLIGFFVNTLALRIDLSRNPTFLDLLSRVREMALEAYDHQDLPFEKLVEALQPERGLNRSPLFQVMFALQSTLANPGSEGERFEFVDVDNGTTKFDLTLSLFETEQRLKGALEYNTDLFDGSTIARMVGQYKILLAEIAADPGRRIADLPMLPEDERQQLLVAWNANRQVYPPGKCIHQWIEMQAEQTPEAVALVFENQQVTYGELNCRANQLAHYLQRIGVGPETLVGIFMERSIEAVVSFLGVLKAGGAYVPLSLFLPKGHLAAVLDESRLPVLLVQQEVVELLPLTPARVVIVDVDHGEIEQESKQNPVSQATDENLVYVLFTSGSTGVSKGVAVEHRQLVNYVRAILERLEIPPAASFALISTFAADLGNTAIFPALCTGGCLHIISQERALAPDAFAGYLRERTIDGLKIVPSHMAVLMQSEQPVMPRQRLILGGEASSWDLVKQLCEQKPDCLIFNHYGPTETTVGAVTYKIHDGHGWLDIDYMKRSATVPLGHPLANTQIYILDSRLQPMPMGAPGELFIGGKGVARGYLNRSGLTAERFIPNPFDGEGERLYRTGDLARYLPDGNIEFLGRLDNQVKIRGFRVEMEGIGAVLKKYPSIDDAVVLAVPGKQAPDELQLVAFYVADVELAPLVNDLRDFLRRDLPEYMLPSAFVRLDAMPLTSNGKVDRRALLKLEIIYEDTKTAFVSPRSPLEEVVARVWADTLKADRIGVYDNFFEMGGHSLLVMRVIARLRAELGVDLPARSLFEAPTVSALVERIQAILGPTQDPQGFTGRGEDSRPKRAATLRPIPRTGNLPLSFAQQRLWFLAQLEGPSATYNIPKILRIEGVLSGTVLEKSLTELVRRHEILHTTVTVVDDDPVQVIILAQVVKLPVVDLRGLPGDEREAEAQKLVLLESQKPFDLEQGPLLRFVLFKLAEAEHLLFVNVHHIISDAWSSDIFIREMFILYEAYLAGKTSPLPELTIQYADFAVWQREWLQGKVLEEQLTYWKERLSGKLPLLALPTDRPRPPVQTSRGAVHLFALPAPLIEGLKALGQREGATLFMTLLATFKVLLYRYTSQADLLVGVPVTNRNYSEIQGLIGFFVNTLVLRTNLAGNPTFLELLAQVRETALGAYDHQDLPFEMLVEALNPERDLSRSAIFQVTFSLVNDQPPSPGLLGLKVRRQSVDNQTAKFDLALSFDQTGDELLGAIEYNTDLFDYSTIAQMAEHLRVLLDGIIADPETLIDGLPLLNSLECHKLLVNWNRTGALLPQDQCVHQLFEAQVRRTPQATALMGESLSGQAGELITLTYDELNRKANQLARVLRDRGVQPDTLVGLLVERSVEMIIGLLAILKSGAAYLPLDPSYPPERLEFVLQDAQAPVLLTQSSLAALAQRTPAQVLYLDGDWETQFGQQPQDDLSAQSPEHLAYVIYTSGSTGRPKGAMIEHRSVVNLWAGLSRAIYANHLPIDRDTVLPLQSSGALRVSVNAPLQFDGSVKQWLMLLSGHCLVVAPQNVRLDGAAMKDFVRSTRLDVLDCVPTQLRLFLEAGLFDGHGWAPQAVLVGGEAIDSLLWQTLAQSSTTQFYNVYGPTECTVDTTICWVNQYAERPSIGRPVNNVRVYVLDHNRQPVPVNVPGELYIAGAGVGRGYWNRSALTGESFLSDPFCAEPGGRMYKTGDRVRYLADGAIEYLGRIDQQVKIRGFRIELEEIEAVLREHPGIDDAAVVVREDHQVDGHLVAFVVVAQQPELDFHELSGSLRNALRRKLPDYMLPSAFVQLDAIPLTPNGKVDRKALPMPDYVSLKGRGYVAPRNEMEKILAEIWAQVLGLSWVSVNDDFFELGGNSLLSVRLISRINQVGLQLSLRQFLEHTTVAGLAGAIKPNLPGEPHDYMTGQRALRASSSNILLLQPSGRKPPLFFTHPSGGTAVCYVPLARILGVDQPSYGLQAVGLYDGQPLDTDVRVMAERYVDSIQHIFPEGPYFLAGWSFGGVVAFEMARQLVSLGRPVNFLGMIDTLTPIWRRKVDEASNMVRFIKQVERFYQAELNITLSDLRQLLPEEYMQYMLKRMQEMNLDTSNLEFIAESRMFVASVVQGNAAGNYEPGIYPGKITVFRAKNQEPDRIFTRHPDFADPAWGWGRYSTQPVETHLVTGSHTMLVEHPYVKTLAEVMQECLVRAQTQAGQENQ